MSFSKLDIKELRKFLDNLPIEKIGQMVKNATLPIQFTPTFSFTKMREIKVRHRIEYVDKESREIIIKRLKGMITLNSPLKKMLERMNRRAVTASLVIKTYEEDKLGSKQRPEFDSKGKFRGMNFDTKKEARTPRKKKGRFKSHRGE